jgi:hypothetical protein
VYSAPIKVNAGTYSGVYEMDGDRLRICFSGEPGGKRPVGMTATGDGVLEATLVRAPVGFTGFPKDVTVTALGPTGKPVSGAVVSENMNQRSRLPGLAEDQGKNPGKPNTVPEGAIHDEDVGWTFHGATKTGADGTARLRYEACRGSVIVRDPATKQMGVATVSPASALRGPVEVAIRPECKVTASVACDELVKAGLGGKEFFNSTIATAGGSRTAGT